MQKNNKAEYDIWVDETVQSKITVFQIENNNAPVIICMPAMGVTASYYEPLALNLCSQGFHAITSDLRGVGHSSVRASRSVNFGYHEMVNFDWPAVVEKVKNIFPDSPIYLLGHSLGGQLNALYTSQNQEQVSGIIFVAAGSVYYKGWSFPKSIGILLGTQLAKIISKIWGYLPGKQLGFGGKEARTVIRDWAHCASTCYYEPENSSFNYETALSTVNLPILTITLEGDSLAPVGSAKNLCDKMSSATVYYQHMTDYEMVTKGLNHFKWVKHSLPIAEKIKYWVGSE